MAMNLTTLKANYIPTQVPPLEGTIVSQTNQSGANQQGTNQFVSQLCDQIDTNVTPTGGLANNHYSTASVDSRVFKPEKDSIKSTEPNLIGYTFNQNAGTFGISLIKFAKAFLLPNSSFTIKLPLPLWFYANINTKPKFVLKVFRSISPTFSSYTQLNQESTQFLLPEAGRQGQNTTIEFYDYQAKSAGTYYYGVQVFVETQFGQYGGTFAGDLYCLDTVLRLETEYNITNTNF